MTDEPLLAVKDLTTEFRTAAGPLRAVDRVSLSVAAGEAVGIVGESGCGKSVTALSILSLIPDPPGRISGGEVLFKGEDLLRAAGERLRRLRGDRIGMVFQEPASALNPVFTAGEQVAEVVRAHRGERRARARQQVIELFARVGIPDPERRYRAYPHQLSGGMQQRVMLAMAMICEPDLLIADEPTSALDVTTQAQIMHLLQERLRHRGTALLLISHDLGLVAEACHRVVVLYAGQVVESAPAAALFEAPAHPYTAALLRSIRSFSATGRLYALPGGLPDLHAEAAARPGCRFAERCPQVQPGCRTRRPELRPVAPGREVRCVAPLIAEAGEGEAS
jgi:oligopeptide/dipeptide ABC transporter ATP-binding protein